MLSAKHTFDINHLQPYTIKPNTTFDCFIFHYLTTSTCDMLDSQQSNFDIRAHKSIIYIFLGMWCIPNFPTGQGVLIVPCQPNILLTSSAVLLPILNPPEKATPNAPHHMCPLGLHLCFGPSVLYGPLWLHSLPRSSYNSR